MLQETEEERRLDYFVWKSQEQEKVTAAGNLHYLVTKFSTIETSI